MWLIEEKAVLASRQPLGQGGKDPGLSYAGRPGLGVAGRHVTLVTYRETDSHHCLDDGSSACPGPGEIDEPGFEE